MSQLLYIESSPRKGRSHSIEVARAFLEAYRKAHPEDRVETLDLWREPLPPFDADTIASKFAVLGGGPHTDAQASAWNAVRAHAEQFAAADKYLFSVPMWNFGIPYVLKHYIDVVTLPGIIWSRANGDYQRLLEDKRAAVIYASAGAFRPGTEEASRDFQKPYFRYWLRFVGVDDLREIVVAPTSENPERMQVTKESAKALAEQVALAF